ncbi:polycystic kidney disease 2-like 1 protein [Schistocerca serialis cubense]|uniref:polycystic kidney disease 2-like 1 protein n=1 Tax=Schistocerca serialis cubense TaxID=2023355 RepID=UPI00214EAB50|nr:polycystic kidney disease 2-like 1 protein [Schistocerca serialis cubense]
MIEGLYRSSIITTTKAEIAGQDRKVSNENKVLGVPRLRQLRVRNDSCEVPAIFTRTFSTCYDAYSSAAEEKEPFGPRNTTAWRYTSSEELDGISYMGTISNYHGGGYYQDLSIVPNETVNIVASLKKNLWINRSTRAVFLDFTVYNANINLFCVIKLLFEFPPTGGVLSSHDFTTMKLIRYVEPLDYAVMGFEFLFIFFVLFFTMEEVIEMMFFKLQYLFHFWNYIDLVILLLSYISIAYSLHKLVITRGVLEKLIENTTEYSNLEYIALWEKQCNAVAAFLVFFIWIKVLKYINITHTTAQLNEALKRCAKDLAAFGLLFFIAICAYAQLGYSLFGTKGVTEATNTIVKGNIKGKLHILLPSPASPDSPRQPEEDTPGWSLQLAPGRLTDDASQPELLFPDMDQTQPQPAGDSEVSPNRHPQVTPDADEDMPLVPPALPPLLLRSTRYNLRPRPGRFCLYAPVPSLTANAEVSEEEDAMDMAFIRSQCFHASHGGRGVARDFRGIGISVVTLLRTIVGYNIYESIQKADWFFAPIYYIAYVVFVFLILLNMFIAIIVYSYSEVKAEIAVMDDDLHLTDFLKRHFKNVMEKFGIYSTYEPKSKDKEKKLTYNDIREILRECKFTDLEIEMFFAKYDITGERIVTEHDTHRMLRDMGWVDKEDEDVEPEEDSGVSVDEFEE